MKISKVQCVVFDPEFKLQVDNVVLMLEVLVSEINDFKYNFFKVQYSTQHKHTSYLSKPALFLQFGQLWCRSLQVFTQNGIIKPTILNSKNKRKAQQYVETLDLYSQIDIESNLHFSQ